MKLFLKSIEQSDGINYFPNAHVFLLNLSIIIIILGLYLSSIAFNWNFYFFLVLFCVAIFVLAIIDFDLAFLFVPLTLTNPYTLSETGTNLHISELVLLILFIVWFVRIIISGERIIYPKKLLLPTLIIIASAVLSLIAAKYFLAGLQQIIRFIEILLIFFIVVIQYSRSEYHIRRVLVMLIFGGLCASLVGISQFITETSTMGTTHRVFGWHGGGYGAVIASTLLLSICTFFYRLHGMIKILSIITIPFASLALILSQTRAWIAALVLVMIIMLLWIKRDMIKKILLTGLLVLGIGLMLIQTNLFGLVDKDYFETALHTAFRFRVTAGKQTTDNASLLLRFNVWRVALEQYLSHPITGIGAGNLRIANYFTGRLGKPAEGEGYIDNQYIQFFVETGTIAGIMWIVYIIQAMVIGIQSIKKSKDTILYPPVIGFFSSFLVFVIGGFFWVITPQHELFALMSLFIGLLYGAGKILENNKLSKNSIR